MKLYKDMTAEERAAMDQLFEDQLFWQKVTAEAVMKHHDSLPPVLRQMAHEEEIDFEY